jgi:hypothetical protein
MTTLKETFEEINRHDCFGYSPTSGSIKPAHIANGWFRRVLGQYFDPTLLNQTVVHWTQDTERNPSERLLADHPSIFEPFQEVARRREFAEFRADLKLLVSPVGGAVNNGNRQSSYNITCERHLTEDYNDRSVGSFLYHLIATDLGDGPSATVALLKNILANPRDEVSSLTLPLIAQAKRTDLNEGNYPAETVFKKRGKQFVSTTIRNLRAGFDQLATFEEQYGGSLDALRRLVSFGVFAIMLHMANRQTEGAGKPTLSPLLVYFPERQRSTAYQASHYTYNLARQSIETLYTDRIREWLILRVGERPTVKKCERFIEEMEFGQKTESGPEYLARSFRSFSTQMTPLLALAEAMRDTIFREWRGKGTPLEFYRSLGTKIGFIKGHSAPRSYFTLEGSLLEAVLASVLPQGEMTFRHLLDALSERYGVITGGRPEDAELLLNAGVGQATVQDLRSNANLFRQHLRSLGWARQFADGVLIVKVPEGLQ